MPVVVLVCPSCGRKFGVSQTALGGRVACAHCGSTTITAAPVLPAPLPAAVAAAPATLRHPFRSYLNFAQRNFALTAAAVLLLLVTLLAIIDEWKISSSRRGTIAARTNAHTQGRAEQKNGLKIGAPSAGVVKVNPEPKDKNKTPAANPGAAPIAPVAAQTNDASEARRRIQGDWRVTEVILDGTKFRPALGPDESAPVEIWTFDGKNLVTLSSWRASAHRSKWTFTLDGEGNITLSNPSSGAKTSTGAYKMDGDPLELSINWPNKMKTVLTKETTSTGATVHISELHEDLYTTGQGVAKWNGKKVRLLGISRFFCRPDALRSIKRKTIDVSRDTSTRQFSSPSQVRDYIQSESLGEQRELTAIGTLRIQGEAGERVFLDNAVMRRE